MSITYYIIFSTFLIVFGAMYVYFPAAWPQLQRNVLLPYLLWIILLVIFYITLQQRQGEAILKHFKEIKN